MNDEEQSEEERALLIEALCSAHRDTDLEGKLLACPAWHDLDGSGRLEGARIAAGLRQMEAALDPRGLSTTGHAVMRHIMKARART
jgi:hypothetical protein